MKAFLQKHWKWLLPVALVGILWVTLSKSGYSKLKQNIILFCVALVAFYLLGILLLALELPLLVVAAAIVVLAYGAQSIYDYFTIATTPAVSHPAEPLGTAAYSAPGTAVNDPNGARGPGGSSQTDYNQDNED